MHEPGVIPVVGGDEGTLAFHYRAAAAHVAMNPDKGELLRDRTFDDSREEILSLRVIDRQPAYISAEERAGPADDGAKDLLGAAQAVQI